MKSQSPQLNKQKLENGAAACMVCGWTSYLHGGFVKYVDWEDAHFI